MLLYEHFDMYHSSCLLLLVVVFSQILLVSVDLGSFEQDCVGSSSLSGTHLIFSRDLTGAVCS